MQYVPLRIGAACLRSLWVLTLGNHEWGGQLRPRYENGRCQLSCRDVTLIKGTGLAPHADAKHYQGQDTDDGDAGTADVLVAVTPLYDEVFQTFPLCQDRRRTVNAFFHTHPLHMVAVDGVGVFAPPSVGDVFAHVLLSNFRNVTQHGQLNTCLLMAYEGLYVYTIMPHAFASVAERIRAVVAAWRQTHALSSEEEALLRLGELPAPVIEILKADVFGRLRAGAEAFHREMWRRIRRRPAAFAIEGAPVVGDAMWSCRGCVPAQADQCAFFRTMQQPQWQAFVREDNPWLAALHRFGLHYEFYPAPFDKDIIVCAPSAPA